MNLYTRYKNSEKACLKNFNAIYKNQVEMTSLPYLDTEYPSQEYCDIFWHFVSNNRITIKE